MKQRCKNPKAFGYENYGGRGIRVCDRWLALANFVADNESRWQPGLTIERIDNNGNYTPENTTWVTQKRQAQNRRDTWLLTYAGRTQSRADWAEEYGLLYTTFVKRIEAGWGIERALTQPVRSYT